MNESLHYLLMVNHLLFQKALLAQDLTSGQPKILDYLLYHDGAGQKEIADACHIEPSTLTGLLLGIENKGLIVRKNVDGNRRSLSVYLTDEGTLLAEYVLSKFKTIKEKSFSGFSDAEKEKLTILLTKMNKNLLQKGGVCDEQK